MKFITKIQGSHELMLVQCSRCKEVFCVTESAFELLDNTHKEKCSEAAKGQEETFDFKELLHMMRWIEKRDSWQVLCAIDEEKLLDAAKKELSQERAKASRGIPTLLKEAVSTDGAHHKQWYLEQIAEKLNLVLPDHEEGIAP